MEPSGIVVDSAGVEIQQRFLKFLDDFRDEEEETEGSEDVKQMPSYRRQIHQMVQRESTTLFVDFNHILEYNGELAEQIEDEFYRYEPFLKKAIQLFVARYHGDYVKNEEEAKEFWIGFYNVAGIQKLRGLRCSLIGRLLCISATVTRTSEVRPELLYGIFYCGECGTQAGEGVEQQFKYTEPSRCANEACTNMNKWHLDLSQSKFVDWQKCRVQENSADIPGGSMPRSIDVVLRHEVVEQIKAGDRALFTGTLIVVPDVSQMNVPGVNAKAVRQAGGNNEGGSNGFKMDGIRGMKDLGAARDLTYRLCFLANHVQPADVSLGAVNIRSELSNDHIINQFTPEEIDEVYQMKESKSLYRDLVQSIAPAVYGHEEVKKGILLMLFGGVHKTTPEGINLRGDINIAVVGDPSTSKSQFLKYVVSFLPRAVYTSGKASSAAGLTATVVRDPDTDQYNIEAGALMLADNGICCIDEFDKMEVKDQVAIHEAMEQQTISIAKAGIHATFNARASILAAANPIAGRYDKSKTLKSNLNITAPIMSRFDLFFVVLDECEESSDRKIAEHIVSVHQKKDRALTPPYSSVQIQRYIKFARCIDPKLNAEAKKVLVEQYKKLRQSDSTGASRSCYRITVRQLESIVRLSEALARLHCEEVVKVEYVYEAVRLLKTSIINVETSDVRLGSREENEGDVDMEDEQFLEEKTDEESSISFSEFSKISSVLLIHITPLENGISQQELCDWYLNTHDHISSQALLISRQKTIHKVIQHMIDVDKTLLEIEPSQNYSQKILLKHPDCAV